MVWLPLPLSRMSMLPWTTHWLLNNPKLLLTPVSDCYCRWRQGLVLMWLASLPSCWPLQRGESHSSLWTRILTGRQSFPGSTPQHLDDCLCWHSFHCEAKGPLGTCSGEQVNFYLKSERMNVFCSKLYCVHLKPDIANAPVPQSSIIKKLWKTHHN